MLQRSGGTFRLSHCQMKTIKAQFCFCKSQNIHHSLSEMKAVMCGKATLLDSCVQEFRGKGRRSSLFCLLSSLCLPLFPCTEVRQSWNQSDNLENAVLTLCHFLQACVLSDRIDSSWCCCTFNVTFYVHVCSNRVATSTDDLNLYHPQTDNAGATSLSLSLLVYLI